MDIFSQGSVWVRWLDGGMGGKQGWLAVREESEASSGGGYLKNWSGVD